MASVHTVWLILQLLTREGIESLDHARRVTTIMDAVLHECLTNNTGMTIYNPPQTWHTNDFDRLLFTNCWYVLTSRSGSPRSNNHPGQE